MRATWLPDVLRAAGLTVREVSGWRSRGSDSWGPIRGVTCHATAGSRGSSDQAEINVLLNGSPSAPPPIAQLYLSRTGVWHVVASGRCNHNLVGWAGPNEGLGNSALIGVEAANDNRGEPWPAVQLRSYERGVAAICRHLGIRASRVAGHKEHQPWPDPNPDRGSSKSDPSGINMTTFRQRVAAYIEGDDDDMTKDQFLEMLQHALPRVRYNLVGKDGKRHWAGRLMNRDEMSGEEAAMWGLGVAVHEELMPKLTAQQKLIEQLVANQSGLTVEQVRAAVAAGVREVVDPEMLAEGLADRLEGRVDQAVVAAALRDLLGLPEGGA